MRWSVLLLLQVVATSFGARADTSCFAPEVTVDEIEFEANGWVDEVGLLELASWSEGMLWNEQQRVAADDKFTATKLFRKVSFATRPSARGCRLTVTLDRKPMVRSVDLRGTEVERLGVARGFWFWITGQDEPVRPPSDRETRRLLGVRVGSMLDDAALRHGTERILERYAAAGFPRAQVATRVLESAGAADLSMRVRARQPVVIRQLGAVCDDEEAAALVLEELTPLIGKPRTRSVERKMRRQVLSRLRRAGFFSARVRLDWVGFASEAGELRATVDPGAKSAIEIVGNRSISKDELLSHSQVFDRLVFSANSWARAAKRMRQRYQVEGFYKASVEVDTSNQDTVRLVVTEGPRLRLGDVEFVGNRSVDSASIEVVVATGRSRWLSWVKPPRADDETIGADIERISRLYLTRGFESAQISADVSIDDAREKVNVVYSIEEGPRSMIRSARGMDTARKLGVAVPWNASEGDPFDSVALEANRDRTESLLQQRGYRDASVETEVARSHVGEVVDVDITWTTREGPLYQVGKVVVQGNADVRDIVVRRELKLEPGRRLDSEELLDAQQEIYNSGVFRNVSITTRPLGESDASAATRKTDIEVTVVPRAPGRFGYGVGYDTRRGLTAFAETSYANLNHRAQTIRLRGTIGVDSTQVAEPTQYLLNLGFDEPSVADGSWELHLNALAERNTRSIDQYSIERFSLALGASRRLDFADGVQVGADVQTERANVFDVLPVPFRERDQRDSWNTSVSPFLVYDGRDSAFNPRSGFFESLRLRYAIPGISNTPLFELGAQHTQLIPLWWDWVFVYSLRAGWVRSLDRNPLVPIRQRFFVGGGESVRGFAVNSIGPYDGNGNEIGGDLAIVVKSEVRIPLFWGLGLVVFLDGGGNYLLRCDGICRDADGSDSANSIHDAALSFDNFRRSAGLGLRYVTPVGPISVDYGVKLDRRVRDLAGDATERESLGAFSVSVGARF